VHEDLLHVSLAVVAHLVVAGEDQALQAMLIGFQVEGEEERNLMMVVGLAIYHDTWAAKLHEQLKI
jgi:hypothetical protein